MKMTRILTVFGAVAVSAALLAGCRSEEQGRLTEYQPGVYLGKKDNQLSSAQVRDLRLRSFYQSDAVTRNVGGGAHDRVTANPLIYRPGILGADLQLIGRSPTPGTGAEATGDNPFAVDVGDLVAITAQQSLG